MNPDHPFFSIITITLNSGELSLATAQSVLSQTFRDYEYLVKDGGSSDGTVSQLNQLGIEVIVAEDHGIYDAMNQALKRSRGDYVYFLNAGDTLISPSVLEQIHQTILESQYPSLVFGDIRILGEHPFMDEDRRDLIYSSRLGRFYLFRRMICHQAWFMRRDLIEQCHGFSTTYRLLSDYDLLLKVVLKQRARYRKADLLTVNYLGGGASEVQPERLAAERACVVREYFHPLEIRCYEQILKLVDRFIKPTYYRLHPHFPSSVRNRLNGA